MGPAWTILAKDLRLRLRDRSVLLFAVVVPLGLTWLFGLILPGEEDLELRAAVVDEDGSEIAAGFSDGVVPGLVEAGLVEEVDVADRDAAAAAVEDGELDVVWVVPAGFGAAVESGAGARLEVLTQAGGGLQRSVATGIAESYATRTERAALAVATTAAAGEGVDEARLAAVAEDVVGSEPALTLADLPAEDRQLESTSRMSAGMAAFFVFFTVQYGVTGLLEERQLGTLPRLLAAPLTAATVHVGKALGALLLGLVSMTVLAVASALLLDGGWGPTGGVALLIVAIVLAAIGLMALVGTFARTAEQASNLQSIVAIVLGMAGGVFFPVPLDEGVLRVLGLLSPHAWFIRGLGDVTGTGSWHAALPAAAALVAFGLAAAVPAVWRLRRPSTW